MKKTIVFLLILLLATGFLQWSAVAAEDGLPVDPLQKRITLECRETGLQDILRALAAEAGINLILGAEVPAATVSLNFHDISIEGAMGAILASHNLGVIREKEVYRVVNVDEIVELGEDLTTEYISLNYSKAVDVVAQVESLLSSRGRLRADSRTNTLMVRDTPSYIEQVRQLLAVLDIPTPQVMIEARIVTASNKAVKELGIQWGGSYSDTFGSGNRKTFSAGGSTDAGSFADTAINLPTPAASSAITFGISKLDSFSFNVRLTALEEKDMIKTLSNPRVMVLDNHRAKIGQGKEIPYKSSDVDNPDTEFKEAELSLEVVPHVTKNGEITLELQIKNDSQGENTGQGEPIINTQNVNTTLLIQDGATAVIGGIILSNNIQQKDGVPGLSRVPLFGNLFKHDLDDVDQGELIVFITPTIVKR
ncbi:MAG: type IV pilus secretin PilQ [Deltaproteobacteria bacterium]|nr:type IV pilus secretin PilQ [Candidatus Anaeroferrophillus wilburensis]MBN2889426.1 type IV pilus secretin PilQ [Deltaproteobacteria bacterium]